MTSSKAMTLRPLSEADDELHSDYFWNMDTRSERKRICLYRWQITVNFYFAGGWFWS